MWPSPTHWAMAGKSFSTVVCCGVAQQSGHVVDRGPALDVGVSQQKAVRVHDHSQVMRPALRDRLGQRLKVGFPGFILLAQPVEPALHEGRTLAELQLLLHSCLGHFLLECFCAFALLATKLDSSPWWK